MNTTNCLWLKKCFKLSGEGIKDQTIECETRSFSEIFQKASGAVKDALRDVDSSGCRHEINK